MTLRKAKAQIRKAIKKQKEYTDNYLVTNVAQDTYYRCFYLLTSFEDMQNLQKWFYGRGI